MRHIRTTLLMASQQLSSAVQWSTAQKAVQRLVPPLSFDSRTVSYTHLTLPTIYSV